MSGLSTPQTAREEAIRIAWMVITVLITAIAVSILCFLYLDRPRLPGTSRPMTEAGHSAARSFWDVRP